jgi:hypothetical protein
MSGGDRAEHGREPSEVGQVALVEREHALIEVAEEVVGLDVPFRPRLRTLQKFSIPLVWTRPSTYVSAWLTVWWSKRLSRPV